MEFMKVKDIKFNGLFRTIFLASMLCMLVPVLLLSFITIRSFSGNIEDTIQSNLKQLSIEKMNEVSSMISDQVEVTKAVAQSPFIEE